MAARGDDKPEAIEVPRTQGAYHRLVVVNDDPFNAETPLAESGIITPNEMHYVRSHGACPELQSSNWQLQIAGTVDRPYQLAYEALLNLPSRSLPITMECAGNGRTAIRPPVVGEQWQYGAVSTAVWTGVPLWGVLEEAGVRAETEEILIEGADRPRTATSDRPIAFARGLPLEKARHAGTLLAYLMNGEPLSREHGFPVRLIVPDWYGMASVKWVVRIEALANPFQGYFQTERYVMAHPERGDSTATPLSIMQVRSVITSPKSDSVLAPGWHRIRGLAWSGAAPISMVEVSVDNGNQWVEAELDNEVQRHAWRPWSYLWQATRTGSTMLRSRAFDAAGRTQPSEPDWNYLGYSNNAIQAVSLRVADHQL